MPCWKPLRALRATCLSDRMRPLPVVFLLFAFSPQLSVHCIVSMSCIYRRTYALQLLDSVGGHVGETYTSEC